VTGMFEPPGTPTFLGLAAEEWEALSNGVSDGFQGSTFAPLQIKPDEKEPHYYKAANLAGRLLKLCVYAVCIKVLGLASGGLI
jgi:hypothetical protein